MVDDHMGAEAVGCAVGVEKGINEAEAVIENVGQAHGGQRVIAVAIFDHARADRCLLDHGREFEDVHIGHPTIGMAGIEVAAKQIILRLGRPGRARDTRKPRVAPQNTPVPALRREVGHADAR